MIFCYSFLVEMPETIFSSTLKSNNSQINLYFKTKSYAIIKIPQKLCLFVLKLLKTTCYERIDAYD